MLNRRSFLKWATVLSGGLAGLRNARWAAAGTGQRFFIPPTIHHVTENNATLYFRLGEPTSTGIVRLTVAGETVQEIPFIAAADTLRQQILFEGLAPATTYQYQVLVDDIAPPVLDFTEPWSGLQFTTPPFEWPLRVATVGDSGFGDDTTLALAKRMSLHEPDLFFHLGDVVYWMHEYNNDHFVNWYMKYFLPFYPMLKNSPHYATFGNHEQDGPAQLDGWPSYYWMFPPFNEDQHEGARTWYGFDINGIQFLSLNSQLFYSYPELKAEQDAWLDEKLARTDVLYTIPFFHVQVFTSSSPHQWDGIYIAEQWTPKFEAAASKVPLVLSGHAHVYERSQQNGVNYIIAGGGSATIYGQGENIPQSVALWRLASYPIIDFYEDRIHLTAYSAEDEILDELEIEV
jgi:hypothetical protein